MKQPVVFQLKNNSPKQIYELAMFLRAKKFFDEIDFSIHNNTLEITNHDILTDPVIIQYLIEYIQNKTELINIALQK